MAFWSYGGKTLRGTDSASPVQIGLKHVVWRFRIHNYFHEIFKFRDFINTLRNFAKSVFAHIFTIFQYFAKVIIYSKSPDHVL